MPDSIVKANNITALDGTGVGIPDGTVASPGLKFTADTDSGLYRIGANDIAIAVNGAKAFEADPNTVSIFTGGVERFRVASTGQQSSVVPDLSGSNTTLYPEYKCRAWVNFNGSTLAVRGSGNVTSITRNGGAGGYRVNFTTNMPDVNYCAVTSDNNYGITSTDVTSNNIAYTNVYSYNIAGNLGGDVTGMSVAVFR